MGAKFLIPHSENAHIPLIKNESRMMKMRLSASILAALLLVQSCVEPEMDPQKSVMDQLREFPYDSVQIHIGPVPDWSVEEAHVKLYGKVYGGPHSQNRDTLKFGDNRIFIDSVRGTLTLSLHRGGTIDAMGSNWGEHLYLVGIPFTIDPTSHELVVGPLNTQHLKDSVYHQYRAYTRNLDRGWEYSEYSLRSSYANDPSMTVTVRVYPRIP